MGVSGRNSEDSDMPLLQTPGPAPDFATHAFVKGNIGHIGLKDYQGEKYVILVFYPMDFVYAESITPFSNRMEDATFHCWLTGPARSQRNTACLMPKRESPGRPWLSLMTVALLDTWLLALFPLIRSSTIP